MPKQALRETDLYAPIKQFLEAQGYEVKAEVGKADLVAMRGEEDPVVIELKVGFSLTLIHQAIDRQKLTDFVYIAVPHGSGRPFAKSLKNNLTLCRRLGLGLLTVRIKDGFVTPHLDPAPYKPRQIKPRKDRLLREFSRRVGDPNEGGATRRGLVTTYRQDALKCLKLLSEQGPTKAALVARQTGVENARRIMADDHYGWFEKAATGIYQISPKGLEALGLYSDQLEGLAQQPSINS
ncbi:DUF2161 family putative PD-(D/E)XK-type phosphodiesterase [uncultured Cohaesibacter sp.]|uniref:DUF2161 domain-containing phosphodiesterase n=1 Tax=uncultured Cohaesibacter sp. TaxID=1002546 RepID=UPI00292F32BD|nr:DUF2161 family putative PD-(D/E)XK-type phosphodiesterase [uncultured Cohaesibacter sp.]